MNKDNPNINPYSNPNKLYGKDLFDINKTNLNKINCKIKHITIDIDMIISNCNYLALYNLCKYNPIFLFLFFVDYSPSPNNYNHCHNVNIQTNISISIFIPIYNYPPAHIQDYSPGTPLYYESRRKYQYHNTQWINYSCSSIIY